MCLYGWPMTDGLLMSSGLNSDLCLQHIICIYVTIVFYESHKDTYSNFMVGWQRKIFNNNDYSSYWSLLNRYVIGLLNHFMLNITSTSLFNCTFADIESIVMYINSNGILQ